VTAIPVLDDDSGAILGAAHSDKHSRILKMCGFTSRLRAF